MSSSYRNGFLVEAGVETKRAKGKSVCRKTSMILKLNGFRV